MGQAYDLTSKIDLGNALDLLEITSNGTTVGNVIDTHTVDITESNAFGILSQTITDGSHEVQLFEDDQISMATENQVTDLDQIIGDLPVFTSADSDALKQFGYVGFKRFLRIKIVSTGVTSGGFFNAIFALGNKRHIGEI